MNRIIAVWAAFIVASIIVAAVCVAIVFTGRGSESNTDLLALIETPPYDRDEFGSGWRDADDDCIDTRNEVLIRKAVGPVIMTASGCTVVTGEWYDLFTDQTFTDSRDLHVSHVVALEDAWYAGAWAWSRKKRIEFANDEENLRAIGSWENQRKAAHGPADYTPANAAHLCAYLEQYVRVKMEWLLLFTKRDRSALVDGLTNCAGRKE